MNISKQAIHQMINRRMRISETEAYLSTIIAEIRADHPTLNCRAMYYMIKPQSIGRDKFEAFCYQMGFMVERYVCPRRTTDSSGVIRFENKLSGLALITINQAFSSDITYFEIAGRFYYITFVMDCFSRRILGYSVSKTLITEDTTMVALKMAVKTRGGSLPENVIFHSDGGGQYYDKVFLAYTQNHKMVNSMCEYAYENGKAERLNGIIKNNYLRFNGIKSYEDLSKAVDHTVLLYNNKRPHKSLNYLTPVNFEQQLLDLSQQTRPTMKESLEAEQIFGASSPKKSEQTRPQNQDVFQQYTEA